MSRHVHEYLDTAGRPVGEGRAAAFQQVQTEMRLCPYSGSRHHHAKPMNATALQQMPAWQHVLTMLSWLSQRYRAARQIEITTCADLAQVTSAGIFLVDFLVLRHRHALGSTEIPVLIAGLYKVCLGFQLAYLPEQLADETTPTLLPDSAGFYSYLEESDLLIGEAEVCSGSPAMIRQAYEAIIGPATVAQDALPEPCSSLKIDWEQFDVFTQHAAAIWRELLLYAIETPRFCPLKLDDSRLPSDVQDRLNACLELKGSEILAGQSGLIVDIARAVQEHLVADPLPPLAELSSSAGSLGATVLSWLNAVATADMLAYAPVVASALQPQLARYEMYEATVLTGLDQHLSCIMPALGLNRSTQPLTPAALSHLLGRTMRDWALLR